MGNMPMGSMSAGNGIPPLFTFQKMYWAVVGTAIGIATMVNLLNYVIFRQRLSALSKGLPRPAKPKALFFRVNATITAILREASNASIRIPIKGRTLRLPTVGRTSLVVANVVVLVVLCFYKLDPSDRWSRENIGYRTGFVNMAQLPLIFLLAGKNNIIGYLTGVSHERLNWLHRWCARCLLLTTTIHMGYWFADWAPYDYIATQIRTDTLTKRGVMAYGVLLWIVISSMTPIRGWCYELFVLQHLVSFAVFIGFVYIHTPVEVHIYIWIPVGLFFFDRVVRALRVLYANLAVFHPRQRKAGQMSGFWACKAEFTPLPHDTTRITIQNPPISWSPGQHVFLSCHSIVPLQSHPFTVASIPADGVMEFLVKAERGGTRRLFRHAAKQHGLPTTSPSSSSSSKPSTSIRTVAIEGPYGAIRPLQQFDTVVLLAGSTGATFTLPLLRDLVRRWQSTLPSQSSQPSSTNSSSSIFHAPPGTVTRHVRFIWVVKSRGQLSWFAPQLSALAADVQALRAAGREASVEISVFVTCDPAFTEEHKSLLASITAPAQTQTQTRDQQQQRGVVEVGSETSTLDEKAGAKKAAAEGADDGYAIREVDSASTTPAEAEEAAACGPAGECCCTKTVEDEADISAAAAAAAICTCGNGNGNGSVPRAPSTRSSNASLAPKPLLHPGIAVISGRPGCRGIVRRALEQALGEAAVVVCGPRGLVADVKAGVVALCDERAVHKGTGAQGVFLHTESFGY